MFKLLCPHRHGTGKKIGNEVVDKLVANDFEGITKNFDETMKKTVSAQQIRELWTQVITTVGEYKSRELLWRFYSLPNGKGKGRGRGLDLPKRKNCPFMD